MVVVVMGVSGVGKTTVAQALARRLAWPFVEGDTLHPPANVEKMKRGVPLEDADRWPWLEAVAERMRALGPNGVVACSALKHRYRDFLRDGHDDVKFVYLHGGPFASRVDRDGR